VEVEKLEAMVDVLLEARVERARARRSRDLACGCG